MNSKQRGFLVAALVAVAAAAWFRHSVTSAETKPMKSVDLVFVTGGSGPYWQIAASGARQAGRDLNANVTIEMPKGAENVAEQTAILEKVGGAKAAGVALSPLDAAGQAALIDKLVKAGFVVTFDSDAPDTKRKGYVGTSNFAAGRLCSRLTKEATGGGKVALVMANTTKDNMQDRKGGFQDGMAKMEQGRAEDDKSPKLEIVETIVDEGDDKKCEELVAKALADHPDLKAVVGLNAQHGPILRKVLKDKGKLGDVKIVAFDDAPETLDGIEAGEIYATVAQDPHLYGYEAVRMLCTLCRATEATLPAGTTTYSVSGTKVTKENVKEHRENLKKQIEEQNKGGA